MCQSFYFMFFYCLKICYFFIVYCGNMPWFLAFFLWVPDVMVCSLDVHFVTVERLHSTKYGQSLLDPLPRSFSKITSDPVLTYRRLRFKPQRNNHFVCFYSGFPVKNIWWRVYSSFRFLNKAASSHNWRHAHTTNRPLVQKAVFCSNLDRM